MAISPDGANLYAGDRFRLVMMRRHPVTGELTALQRLHQGPSELSSVAISPDGRHAYGLCGSGFTTREVVAILARDSTSGATTPAGALKQGFDLDGLILASDLALTADGAQVHTLGLISTGSCVVTALDRDVVTGSLSPAASVPYGTPDFLDRCEGQVRSSADGRSVYAHDGLRLTVLARDPTTGSLTPSEVHEQGVGGVDGLAGVGGLVVAPDNRHVYVAGAGPGLAVFARDLATGSLTFVAAPPVAVDNMSLAADPTGAYLYVSTRDRFSGFVSGEALHVLARDPGTGLLAQIQRLGLGDRRHPPFIAGSLVVVPDGRQLLAVDAPGVAVFRRDIVTGRLGFAEVRSAAAAALAVAPGGQHVYTAGETTLGLFVRLPVCDATPRSACRRALEPGKSKLLVNERLDDRRNALAWKLARGDAASLAAFGDPLTMTGYAACLYDASPADQPALAVEVRAGGACRNRPCWKLAGNKLKYSASGLDAVPDGVLKLALRAGAAGKTTLALKATGAAVPLPPLPFAPPLILQLQASNGDCWEARFSAPQVNDGERLRAEDHGSERGAVVRASGVSARPSGRLPRADARGASAHPRPALAQAWSARPNPRPGQREPSPRTRPPLCAASLRKGGGPVEAPRADGW